VVRAVSERHLVLAYKEALKDRIFTPNGKHGLLRRLVALDLKYCRQKLNRRPGTRPAL
jgi:hypothetical protein